MRLFDFLDNLNTVHSDPCYFYCKFWSQIDYEDYSELPSFWNERKINSWHVVAFESFIAFYFDLEF